MSSALSKFFDSASSLPIYRPALGQVYNIPSTKPATATNSAANTRANSKEPTPLPEVQIPAIASDPKSTDDDLTEQQATSFLAETLSNNIRYGTSYMDEHPLVGEPGSFKIQQSKDLQVPIGKENSATEKRQLPVPPPLKTDIATETEKEGKETSPTGMEKSPLSPTNAIKKRKKSKAQTPRTPKTPR